MTCIINSKIKLVSDMTREEVASSQPGRGGDAGRAEGDSGYSIEPITASYILGHVGNPGTGELCNYYGGKLKLAYL